MLKQFLSHLSENQLATAGDKLLLTVSGGVDSVVLVDLFLKAGYTCEVAHVNFQLRGQESNEDEIFVEALCKRYSLPFHVLHADTEAFARQNKISIQMAARELRYSWFQKVLEEGGLHAIATAHHLNDSMETSLFNWVNGSSLSGLVGIPVKNERIIRPLLFATKQEIEAYAKDNELFWREDSSNAGDDYTRNFIRHQLIPRLKEINPSLEKTILKGQQKLADELALSERAFRDWKEHAVSNSQSMIVIDKASLEVGEGNVTLLYRLLQPYGFNFEVSKEISVALHGQSGKVFFSDNHQVVIDRETLLLTPRAESLLSTTIHENEFRVQLGTWNISMEESAALVPSSDPNVAVVDADKLCFPLVWRQWKKGDIFYPLGMENRKKISDFLVDTKVPVPEKQQLTVLESNGEILWVVGYRMDNRYKLAPGTKRALIFTASRDFS